MTPMAGYNQGRAPADMNPYLVIRLKAGWFYDHKSRTFQTAGDEELVPWDDLPKGTTIVYMTPDLAQKPPESLTSEERLLVRYLHVIFPSGSKLEKYMALIDGWICIDEVRLPPEIGLP